MPVDSGVVVDLAPGSPRNSMKTFSHCKAKRPRSFVKGWCLSKKLGEEQG